MAGTYEGASEASSPWDNPEFSIAKAA